MQSVPKTGNGAAAPTKPPSKGAALVEQQQTDVEQIRRHRAYLEALGRIHRRVIAEQKRQEKADPSVLYSPELEPN